jgi:hypothetical protein
LILEWILLLIQKLGSYLVCFLLRFLRTRGTINTGAILYRYNGIVLLQIIIIASSLIDPDPDWTEFDGRVDPDPEDVEKAKIKEKTLSKDTKCIQNKTICIKMYKYHFF